MSKLRLALACSDYDLTHAFVDGTVEVEGVDLNTVVTVPHERHRRVLNGEFDVAEWSIALYLASRPLGLPYTAIPVFPLRTFRHASLFVRADSPIQEPTDLANRRIGVSLYTNSAALWARGFLQHEYGVDFGGVTWITENDEHPRWRPRVPLAIERLDAGKVMEQALLAGEVDALLYPKVPAAMRERGLIRRLFPDYVQAEQAYFERTGLFPIMHTVIVRDEVLAQHSWVGTSLMKAWQQAKAQCYLRYRRAIGYSALVWLGSYLEQQQAVLGPDPFPYSFEQNRRTLETAVQYAHAQYLVDAPLAVEGLFAPSTLASQADDVVGTFYGY